MKKLKKIGKKTVLRSAKLSQYRQEHDIQFNDYFVLRPDVFDLLCVKLSSPQQPQVQVQG